MIPSQSSGSTGAHATGTTGAAATLASGLVRRDRSTREAAEQLLSSVATRSVDSRGRVLAEEPDPDRTAFEVDRDRILHSKAFRRLRRKTQVFLNPRGDHVVTRLTHALQVTQVARAIANGLALNEPLAEAIALGHDVGHSPFGHVGEDALSPYVPGGWHHAAQSVRIFAVLEDRNLTWEVLDGIRAHSWRIEPPPATCEAHAVRFADRIAYLSHDAEDAVRAGLLTPADFPASVRSLLGRPSGGWVGLMVTAVLDASAAAGHVTMEPQVLAVMDELRDFMFERVYLAPAQQAQHDAAVQVIQCLVEHHLADPGAVPDSYRDAHTDPVTQVVDYVAGMTDRFALDQYERITGARPGILG